MNNVVSPIPNLARRLTTEERTMMTSTYGKRMRTCFSGKRKEKQTNLELHDLLDAIARLAHSAHFLV